MINQKRFKTMLVDKGITFVEVANAIGMSRQNLYYHIDNGSLGVSQIESIAKYCKLKSSDITKIFFDKNVT